MARILHHLHLRLNVSSGGQLEVCVLRSIGNDLQWGLDGVLVPPQLQFHRLSLRIPAGVKVRLESSVAVAVGCCSVDEFGSAAGATLSRTDVTLALM